MFILVMSLRYYITAQDSMLLEEIQENYIMNHLKKLILIYQTQMTYKLIPSQLTLSLEMKDLLMV